MTKSKDSKVPQVRFKGIEVNWIEKQFNIITSRVTQISSEDGLPRLEYEDIVSSSGLLNKNIHRKKSNKKGVKFKERDVLFGKLRPYLKNWFFATFEGIAVGDFWVLRAAEAEPYFLYTLIQSGRFEIIANQSAGSKMPRSDWSLVSESYYFTPDSTVEQYKIGEYFNKLDTLIQLHQRKHDKLVTLKQAMLQKMFPQDGAITPEIRFHGFNEDWEREKLGSITQPISNNSLPRENLNYKSGFAKNIHYGDILVKFGEVIDITTDELPFITDAKFNVKLMASKLQDGDIIIADAAEDSSVGKCSEIFGVGNTIVLAGLHTIALRPLLSFAPAYLGYFMNSHSFHDQLMSLMQGTKVLSISKSAIKNTYILFPKDIREQQKIGTYFRKLDELIANHAIQLEKLKQLKSACLAKMFV